MKVILESTPQTTELLTSEQNSTQRGVPARIWQGHVLEIDHAAMRQQLLDICNSIVIVAKEVEHGQTPVDEMRQCALHARQQLLNMATLLDDKNLSIEVHALITRLAHKIDEPQHVVDRFKKELLQHAAPRDALQRAYSLKMFI
jgi:hypothetical protein